MASSQQTAFDIQKEVDAHPVWKPFDIIERSMKLTLLGAALGLVVASHKNTSNIRRATFMTLVTKHGHYIPWLATCFGGAGAVQGLVANLRQGEDWVANAAGTAVGGAVMGLPSKRPSVVIGTGLACAFGSAVFTYTGGRLTGHPNFNVQEEFDRKEQMRASRRRPIEETIAEIGEGRGIKPPGYEERRRQRLKEKYGIIVDPVRADVD